MAGRAALGGLFGDVFDGLLDPLLELASLLWLLFVLGQLVELLHCLIGRGLGGGRGRRGGRLAVLTLSGGLLRALLTLLLTLLRGLLRALLSLLLNLLRGLLRALLTLLLTLLRGLL